HTQDDGDECRLVTIGGVAACRFRADDALAWRRDRRRLQSGRSRGARSVAAADERRSRGLERRADGDAAVARPAVAAPRRGHRFRADRNRMTTRAADAAAGYTPDFVTTGEDLSRSPLWNPDL